jgi:hypothetical protein
MSQGTPAGWYSDGNGATRYWDGVAWTEQVREHGAPPVGPTVESKDGAFARFKKAAADRSAEKRDAKEAEKRKWAEDRAAAGALVTSGTFGLSVVEIYEGGYVRVASGEQPDRPNIGNARTQMAQNLTGVGIGAKTPYEQLRSITFTPAASAAGSSGSGALEGAVGPAVANLLKGTKHLVKASAPGLAAAGIAHVASQGSRTSYLTITTDRQIYTLSNQIPNSVGLRTAKQSHVDVGIALEAVGNGVLGIDTRLAPKPTAPTVEPVTTSEAAAQAPAPSLADHLRELAILHQEGVLSDEEFAGAKARLLSGL